MNGIASHKPRPVVTDPPTIGPVTPAAHASATPNITDLLGRFVMLGSAIQNFNVVRAVHGVERAVSAAVHDATETVVGTVNTVVTGIARAIFTVVFIAALPIEIPLGIYLFQQLVNSPLWF